MTTERERRQGPFHYIFEVIDHKPILFCPTKISFWYPKIKKSHPQQTQITQKGLALERYFKMYFNFISDYVFNNNSPHGGKQHCIPTILIKHG